MSEFEVEKVLKHKRNKNSMKYLIQWKGFTIEEEPWEPEQNLIDCRQKINEYWESKKQEIGDTTAGKNHTEDLSKIYILGAMNKADDLYFLRETRGQDNTH